MAKPTYDKPPVLTRGQSPCEVDVDKAFLM